MQIIDQNNWNRKEHFEFFNSYDDPFFGITTEVDCTIAYDHSKAKNVSFFAFYLHRSILAVNRVKELRCRIVDGDVVLFDEVHAASTIGRPDGTFGFSFIPFSSDFHLFDSHLKNEIKIVNETTGLRANSDAYRKDVIHYSTIPWTKFSSLSHPKKFNSKDTAPKITFGQTFISKKKRLLPVSIHAHHGLADGFHLSKSLEEFQKLLDQPSR
tara:strand:+ start:32 stop:667 length:636 start_codon:yes stop_codon:yes gene_type:complete